MCVCVRYSLSVALVCGFERIGVFVFVNCVCAAV